MKIKNIKQILPLCKKFKLKRKGYCGLIMQDNSNNKIMFYEDYFSIITDFNCISVFYADVIRIEITE